MENLTVVARFVVTPEEGVGGTDYLSEAKLEFIPEHTKSKAR